MQMKIEERGNSYGIRPPKEILASAGILLNETVEANVSNGRIILAKTFRHKILEERLQNLMEK